MARTMAFRLANPSVNHELVAKVGVQPILENLNLKGSIINGSAEKARIAPKNAVHLEVQF